MVVVELAILVMLVAVFLQERKAFADRAEIKQIAHMAFKKDLRNKHDIAAAARAAEEKLAQHIAIEDRLRRERNEARDMARPGWELGNLETHLRHWVRD